VPRTIVIGGDLEVCRLGFGAMRITGPGILGWPADRENALRVLRRAVELGVDLIDTADSYGPEVSTRPTRTSPSRRASASSPACVTRARSTTSGSRT
jgi:aryl-alcohol dehydrogenase-like predicted oxidoreductase